tara:strand:+ start:55 stop:480 length:426 start_codon:yes stop_codon:yes gene_type:complete
MRASDVRAKIIAAIEASAVDEQASSVDVFTHVNIGTREMRSARDRLFTVALSTVPVRSGTLFPTDLYEAGYDVTLMYSDSPAVEDRIAKDVERVSQALEPLAMNNADIARISLFGGPVSEFDGLVTGTVTAQIVYRLDSTV